MNLEQIKELRNKTGASIALCKSCLEESSGDFQKATALLRKRGVAIANKKASRATAEGRIGSYIHSNAKIAALVALYCETDFVARNEEFIQLSKDLAMQIAAMNPLYKTEADVPQEVIAKEEEIERERLKNEDKGEAIIGQIIEGRLRKFYETVCLMKQPFVKDDTIAIESLIDEKIQKLGENIIVGEFIRFEL
jgi:elongation factor Ts